MPTFLVDICRTAYAFNTIEVEAESAEEAQAEGLGLAGDLYFSERESDYSVMGVRLVPD